MLNDGDVIFGPFTIGEVGTRGNSLLLAPPEMKIGKVNRKLDSLMNYIDDSDVIFSESHHAPSTGNWTLDGIIRAATVYRGRVSLNISSDRKSLISYICNELSKNHIYTEVIERKNFVEIVIVDTGVVEEVFERNIDPSEYPLPFLLGYFSFFTFCGRFYNNTDLIYNRYLLIIDDEFADKELLKNNLFLTTKMYGKIHLCPSFGHLLPIRFIIDDAVASGEEEDGEKESFEDNHIIEEVRQKTIPTMIRNLFYQLKFSPGPLNTLEGGVHVIDVKIIISEGGCVYHGKILIAPPHMVDKYSEEGTFVITYSREGIKIGRFAPGERGVNKFFNIAHNGFFEANPQLCEYYDIMVKKMW